MPLVIFLSYFGRQGLFTINQCDMAWILNIMSNWHGSCAEISKVPCFDVEIPEMYLNMWKDRYDEYRLDMKRALNSGGESQNAAADEVIRKYKQVLLL